MIYLALSSTANLSIIPSQDYLRLTNEEGRMNTPSTASGNWTYRLSNRYNTNTYVNLYRLGNMYNYFYNYMPISTSYIKDFDLTYLNEKGFVLRYPTVYSPE